MKKCLIQKPYTTCRTQNIKPSVKPVNNSPTLKQKKFKKFLSDMKNSGKMDDK